MYGNLIGSSIVSQLVLKKASSLLAGVQTITPLVYQGVIAGSEFLTYSAKKLYVLLNLDVNGNTVNDAESYMSMYDESNTLFGLFKNEAEVWDVTNTKLRFITNPFKLHDIYFSRLAVSNLVNLIFVGYKITIP